MKKYEKVYKDNRGRPLVCCVTIANEDSWARGVAVCSPEDEPDASQGLLIAERYALRAIKGREERKITDRRAIIACLKTDCPWTYHMEKAPDLSFIEIRKLFGKFMNIPSRKEAGIRCECKDGFWGLR